MCTPSHLQRVLTSASVLVVAADPGTVVDDLGVAVEEGGDAGRHGVVVQVVQLAVVVGAGRGAQVEVGAAKELILDLASSTAGLLAVGLKDMVDKMLGGERKKDNETS